MDIAQLTIMTTTLTKRQKEVFDFIRQYSSESGISPTIEEIRKAIKLNSVGTVHEHVKNLEKKGFISRDKISRHINLEQDLNSVVQIPICGKISAGQPIEVIEDLEDTIAVVDPRISSVKGYYALKVVGNSMIDEGIFDGDTVVIRKQSVADNGQTVVAVIDEDKATLKKIYREKNRFRLEPRNPSMRPLFRTDVEVRGVVVKVISDMEDQPVVATKTKHGFKTIDLFAGVGGIRIGFENAGFQTVFANDFEEKCGDTYDLNFKKTKLIVEDIRKIGISDLPEFDFLLGGFPCQAFSIAGYREGFNDKKDRGNLFFDIARILKAKKPEGFLLENVKNLKGHDKGRTFAVIEKTLRELGYHIHTKVLNTMEYGNVPQNRERIYIVGFKNKAYADKFQFPKPVKLTKKVTDLLDKNVPEKYYYNGKPLYDRIKGDVKDKNKVYQWRRKYVRENKSGVCPTLTANMGMGGHNVPIIKDRRGIRKLTPKECFRLQGFPEDYVLPDIADSTLYKQAGNSVSVPVVEAVAREMMRVIGH